MEIKENRLEEINIDSLQEVRNIVYSMQSEIGQRVIGYEKIVMFMLISLISNNHIMLEGVPGLAKTYLANEFSKHLNVVFKRIQFTPDMLPSDVTGNMIFNLETRKLEFRPGPVFCNVLLADEINRTPAKVQSALLETMEEKQVSVWGEIRPLPKPFLVIATQNPVEQEGTFPVAEALMDRFLFRYILTYPTREQELSMLRRDLRPLSSMSYLDPDKILQLRDLVDHVYVSTDLQHYMVDFIRRTRENSKIYLGASPRTTMKFLNAAKANALINGRAYVIPEDISYMAHELLNHRLILRPEALVDSADNPVEAAYKVIDEVMAEVEPPK
jgi:MoxR-like ATPase